MAVAAEFARARVRVRDAGFLLVVFLTVTVVGRDFFGIVEDRYREFFHSLRADGASERIVLIDTPREASGDEAAGYLADIIAALASREAALIVSVVPPPAALSALDNDRLETLADLEMLARQMGGGAALTVGKLRERLSRLREEAANLAALVSATATAGNVIWALPDGGSGDRVQNACLDHAVAVPERLRQDVLATVADTSVGTMPDALCQAAAGVGYLNSRADRDAAAGQIGLLGEVHGIVIPALATSVAAAAHGPIRRNLAFGADGSLRFGPVRIGKSTRYRVSNHNYGAPGGSLPFTVIKAADLLEGRLSADRIRGRIALMGQVAPEAGGVRSPQDSRALPAVFVVATNLSNLLNGDFLVRPLNLRFFEISVMLLSAAAPLLLLRLAQPVVRGLVTVGLAVAAIGVQGYLIVAQGIWLEFTTAVVVLLVGAGGLQVLRSFSPTTDARPTGSSDASRTSPAALHQDTLHLQFALLRSQPNTAKTKDGLYDLAVRYAGARQLAQAERVLRHLAMLDPNYRRVQKKLARLSGLRAKKSVDAADTNQAVGPEAAPPDEVPGDRRQTDRRRPDRRQVPGRRLSDRATGPDAPTLKRLGRYNLLRELGSGAMAHVYLAEDPAVRRQVAIKTLALADEFAHDDLPSARVQFSREAEAVGRLNHPNIISIYDFGEENGLNYIVMEYFPGTSTNAYITPGSLLPPAWVLDLTAQAADALYYAHEQNVIHRDIKPANLMYDPGTDTLKITDFGIARLTDTKRTRSGIILGSPTYMAPEQFRGELVDGRADLYSLGVVTYQLLTASVPFRAISIPELLEQIVTQQHEPPTALRSDLPPLIDEVLNQALAKNPAQRFPNARVMAAALRACKRAMAA